MVASASATVDAYLAALPPERREVTAALRALIRRHLPEYAEAMTWGMPTCEVPLDRYPPPATGSRWPTSASPRRRTTTRRI